MVLLAAEAAPATPHQAVLPMTIRRFLTIAAVSAAGIPAGLAVVWVLDEAAGTGWALPAAAMFGLPLLAVSFREPRR